MLHLLIACAPTPAPPGTPNVVLVSLDTLRADRLGAWGNVDGLTPNLDRFAAEAVTFRRAYSQAVVTAASHASMFSSRYPTEEQGGRAPVFGDDKPLLAEVLTIYGYQTGAFVGGADLNPAMNMTRGFATYTSPLDFGSLWSTVPPALEWIDARDTARPFFSFIHGYDAHVHYLKPAPYGFMYADRDYEGPGRDAVDLGSERMVHGYLFRDISAIQDVHGAHLRNYAPEAIADMKAHALSGDPPALPTGDRDSAHVRGVYNGAVSYLDTQFGLLMSGLEARGLLENSVVVVVSDHGEQLGEYGYFNHSWGTGEEETHVVLMIRPPGPPRPARVVDEVVELIDVAPTLIDYAGGTVPAGARGGSLRAAVENDTWKSRGWAFTQGNDRMRSVSVRGPAGRFTYTGLPASSALLPDLVAAASLDGPGFSAEPSDLDRATRADMRERLVVWLRSLAAPPQDPQEALPSALRDALRARGYWDAQ